MDHHHSTTSSSSSSSQAQHLLYHPHHVTIAGNVTGNPTMTSLTNPSIPPELEDLILCSCCHGMFNDTDAQPKMFACRHYFCLKCVNSLLLSNNNNNNNNNNNGSNSGSKSSTLDGESNNNNNPNGQYELYCVHCWKRTELSKPGMKPIDLPTYNAILYLTKHLSLFGASAAPPPTKLDLSDKSNLYQQSNHSNSTNNNSNNSSNNNNVRGSLDLNTLLAGGGAGGGSNKTAGDAAKKQPHENCLTHAMPFSLWCMQCNLLLCRACAGSEDHRKHVVKAQAEARELLYTDTLADIFLMQKYFNELQHFVLKQKEFLLKVLESCTMLKTQIEMELTNHAPTYEISDIKDVILKAKTTVHQMGQSPEDAYSVYAAVNVEKQRLQVKHHDMLFQCKMDDIIRNYRILFDFDLIKKILTCLSADSKNFNTGLDTLLGDGSGGGHQNYFLMLANYCVSQLYTRHVISMRNKQMFETTATTGSLTASTTFPQPPPTGAQQQYEATVAANNDFLTSKFFEQQQQQHSMNDTITSYIYTTPITASTSLLNPPPSYAQLDLIDTSPSDDKHCKIIQNNIIKAVTSAAAAANQKLMNNNNTNNNATNIPPPTLVQQPSNHLYPIYYFNIEMNGIAFGRVLIEVRNDVAPKMAKNFDALCTGEHGFGYKGCTIFQCWENESIITGDFELNNGRGGRSIYEESYFMPDDTKILAIRGSVGMRRSQKRHDNMGLVGSQFRIILREMRGFTGIFAFVIEGLDLVEKISQSGDSTGKPQNNIVIVNCGKLH